MMGNSGHMVTGCPIVKCSFSTKAQQQAKSCLSKGEQLSTADGRALLQNPRGLSCDPPVGADKDSGQHPCLLMAPQVTSCLLDHMV